MCRPLCDRREQSVPARVSRRRLTVVERNSTGPRPSGCTGYEIGSAEPTRSDSAVLVESFLLGAARGAGFRGPALASRASLGAARLRLGSYRCGRRWFLCQRPAFARQSRRLRPGGKLAGCACSGRFPCSRCLSRALRCSLAAAFTHSSGLLRPTGTFGSRFGHSWSFRTCDARSSTARVHRRPSENSPTGPCATSSSASG